MRPSSNLELSNNEEALILAVREMREPPANILLWFTAGLEEASKKSNDPHRHEQDTRLIDIANKWMLRMR